MSAFKRLVGTTYRVENQNGFNAALYDAIGCVENGTDNSYTKQELREAVQGFPERYPAIVQFDDRMLECYRVYVSISYDDNNERILQ